MYFLYECEYRGCEKCEGKGGRGGCHATTNAARNHFNPASICSTGNDFDPDGIWIAVNDFDFAGPWPWKRGCRLRHTVNGGDDPIKVQNILLRTAIVPLFWRCCSRISVSCGCAWSCRLACDKKYLCALFSDGLQERSDSVLAKYGISPALPQAQVADADPTKVKVRCSLQLKRKPQSTKADNFLVLI